jgi:hypothetical protein
VGVTDVKQFPITRERILDMVTWSPRRYRLKDWETLRAPSQPGRDWYLHFPFYETFANVCDASCPVRHGETLRDQHQGIRAYSYLECEDHELDAVRQWLESLGSYVAIRDCMALSFALDYEREDGSPDNPQTSVGALRARAKPYGRAPTGDGYAAAAQLVDKCVEFLTIVSCYGDADAVVAMPASDPAKAFDLPRYLAQNIASRWRRDDLSAAVRTVVARPQMKNLRIEDKLARLDGTIWVDSAAKGRNILLVDDLYQSGTSMNYVTMLLLEAGARRVYGLAVEKTCRNDDNYGGDR